ncbi:hypothetical protein PENSUB_348 [Penicillium subrubescens]|uniref:Major facilitator superfamily (MFS) profile domain-containing protein n=1 Tax=Penicillium subrubescens TaxID=1316194 RepID=A0A1Q5UNA9_9EURO|nr:hypothetical protein PENSUB_348 [Penicillium subrubescens]
MLNGLNILPSYTEYFNLNPATTGLNTASVFIGGFLGPLVSGIIADRLGRRPAIFWGSCMTIVGIILQTASQNIAMFVIARIILGFGAAVTGIAGGVYLSEVFPSRCRAWGAYYWVETKGKTLEEIDALFEGEKHSSVPNIELLRRGEKELDADLVKEQLNADIQLAKVGNSQPSHRLHNLSDFWAGEYQETVQVTGYHDLVSPEGLSNDSNSHEEAKAALRAVSESQGGHP